MGSWTSKQGETFTADDIEPIVKEALFHFDLMKSHSETMADVMKTQQAIVEKILEEDRKVKRQPLQDAVGNDGKMDQVEHRSNFKDTRELDEEGNTHKTEGACGFGDGAEMRTTHGEMDDSSADQPMQQESVTIHALCSQMLELSKTTTLSQVDILKKMFNSFQVFIDTKLGRFSDSRNSPPSKQQNQYQDTSTDDKYAIHQLKKELNDKRSENEKLYSNNISLNTNLKERERSIKDLSRKLESKTRELKDLEDKYQKSKRSYSGSGYMPTFSRAVRYHVSAQLYCPRRGDLTNMVVGEITGLLNNQFATFNTDLTLTTCDKSMAPGIPVLVLCINASRLGTDVSNALSGLTITDLVAVVILHHKEIHALPNQPSERVLTSQDYKKLGGIYDMAFVSGKGIYSCDMNNIALSNIVSFIKRRNNVSA